MRELATIQTVESITPIEGADKIELARMRGNAWQCVVGKDEFKPGDKGCYFEIDSLLPVTEPFMFMASRGRKTNADGSEGFRLRTIKFKGVLSQGLLLPLSKFDKPLPADDGAAVTDLLGIKLYEPPIPACLAGTALGSYPGLIRKTDQDRIQIHPDYFLKHIDTNFEVTIKMDGSSGTFFLNDGEFGVCSRNLQLKETEGNTFWKMARHYELEARLRLLGGNMAIQGEVVGEGIQKNRERIKGQELYIFDIWNIDEQCHLTHGGRMAIIDELNSNTTGQPLKHVPIVAKGTLRELCPTMEDCLRLAEGKGLNTPDREGVVFKSINRGADGQIVSFKAISNKYLLKETD